MSDLRERLERHAVPFLACLNQCSQEDAWNTLECWQTFTDGPKPLPDPLAKHWTQSIDDAAPDLERLNFAGAGVYVTVNQTNGRGRKKEHFVSKRGWHTDLDELKRLAEVRGGKAAADSLLLPGYIDRLRTR